MCVCARTGTCAFCVHPTFNEIPKHNLLLEKFERAATHVRCLTPYSVGSYIIFGPYNCVCVRARVCVCVCACTCVHVCVCVCVFLNNICLLTHSYRESLIITKFLQLLVNTSCLRHSLTHYTKVTTTTITTGNQAYSSCPTGSKCALFRNLTTLRFFLNCSEGTAKGL